VLLFLVTESLKRKDSTVLFESEDSKNYLPIEDISDIYIFGEVTVTKKFLELATQKEILLHFYNYNEYYVGSLLSQRAL